MNLNKSSKKTWINGSNNLKENIKSALCYLKNHKLFKLSLIAICFKTLIFLLLISSDTATKVNFKTVFFSIPPILCYLSFFILYSSIGFLFRGKVHKWSFFVLNFLITILYIGDIWYFRSNRSFLNFHLLQYSSNLNNLGSSVIAMFRLVDLLFLIDLVFIFIATLKENVEIKPYKTQFIALAILLLIPSSYLWYAHLKIDVYEKSYPNQYLFRTTWAQNQTMSALTPLGYHAFDFYAYKKESKPYIFTEEETSSTTEWFKAKAESLPANEYKGIFKNKNLIVLQVESLENFVINEKIDGKEITPTLNGILKNSLYFNNFHEQTHNGTTSDAELLANTSIFPVRSGSTFFRYPNNTYKNSLPNIMSSMGYNTFAIHPDKGSYWNWMPALKSIGFEKCIDSAGFDTDETIGLGLSDGSFLKQLSSKIQEFPQPFYSFSITLSSHTPFNLPKEFNSLALEGPLATTKIGKFAESINYTDNQIGLFLKDLDSKGLLDNSVVVIYGDHEGVHKFFQDEVEKIKSDETWFKNNELKVPLIIYSKDLQGKTVDTIGGQVDLLPTLSYLFGSKEEDYLYTSVGRNLLNTEKNFAVLSTGKVVSKDMDEAQQQNMLKSIEISDKIIRGNFFKKE